MTGADDTVLQVLATLHRYCELIDDADFDGFAALFRHGTWFMVDQPGADPVRRWLEEHVVLHGGETHTRHELTNVTVVPADDRATFSCYVAIWQDLPGEQPNLMVHARFRGAFHRAGSTWQWVEHSAELRYVGDISGHLRDFPGADGPAVDEPLPAR